MDSEDDVVLFIEYKYCTVCHIEQPLRCKHCKHCDACVATHDHHCPWIGNCVGERNKLRFLVFLICQEIQLVSALFISHSVRLMKDKYGFKGGLWYTPGPVHGIDLIVSVGFVICILICIVLSISTMILICFHIWLASQNLTSWEFFSWMRITYMKVWPKKLGSPFSRGSKIENLKQFFCFPFHKQEYIYPWRMPTKLPKL